jgi:hypothetical protein
MTLASTRPMTWLPRRNEFAGWRRAQLRGPQRRLKSGEPIHAQNRRIIGVARTCRLGPRFFVVNWGRTADLQNRSALHSPRVPQARDPPMRAREVEAESRGQQSGSALHMLLIEN